MDGESHYAQMSFGDSWDDWECNRPTIFAVKDRLIHSRRFTLIRGSIHRTLAPRTRRKDYMARRSIVGDHTTRYFQTSAFTSATGSLRSSNAFGGGRTLTNAVPGHRSPRCRVPSNDSQNGLVVRRHPVFHRTVGSLRALSGDSSSSECSA